MADKIVMLDPIGKIFEEAARKPLPVGELRGGRLGFLFNGHVSSVPFWREMERLLETGYGASGVTSIRKDNTFAPAPMDQVEAVAANSDLAFVGVGA